MARMSIDDMILRDPRVLRLGKLCGFDRHSAVGRLLAVFAIVYDRVNDTLDALDIDVAADSDGFAERMIEVDLAVRVRSGVRIRGASKRIEYLQTLSNNASAAGRKSGESRRKKANDKRTVPFMETNGPTNPIPAVPVPVPVPPSVPVPVADPVPVQDMRTAAPPLALDTLKVKVDDYAGKVPEGYRDAIADFDARYQSAYGSGASWGKRQGAQIKALLRAHGSAEVRRRIAILFEAPPSWLKGPYDLGTLVQHFDKLVVGAVRNLTALEQQLERVRMLEAQEAEQKASS